MSELLRQLNNDIADIGAQVRRSLVKVNNGEGNGAGTIWHADGLIITNAHVVVGGHNFRRGVQRVSGGLSVTLPDGRTLPAHVLALDEAHDLAALSVEAHDLPTIQLGQSSTLQPGQWVMAIGHPWGVEGAVTGGVVIGRGHEMPELGTEREWVMVHLHLRPGNSGGPLVDKDGRLVGINTIMTGPEVGGAVPVDVVKRFLKERLA